MKTTLEDGNKRRNMKWNGKKEYVIAYDSEILSRYKLIKGLVLKVTYLLFCEGFELNITCGLRFAVEPCTKTGTGFNFVCLTEMFYFEVACLITSSMYYV